MDSWCPQYGAKAENDGRDLETWYLPKVVKRSPRAAAQKAQGYQPQGDIRRKFGSDAQ